MNNRYKFRGKRVDNRSIVKGYYKCDDSVHYISQRIEFDKGYMLDWIEVHRDTVGQYTGKQDRNDAEVYDGTKLLYENLEYYEICTVFWDDEDASWRVAFDDNSNCTLSDLDKSLITVIGTIHDKE